MTFRGTEERGRIDVILALIAGGALALAGCGPSQPAARPGATVVPTVASPAQTPGAPATSPALVATPSAAPLTVEEYPIVADSVDRPERFEYARRIDPAIREKRAAWRVNRDRSADAIATLERLGFRVATRQQIGQPALHDLFAGDRLLLQGVTDFWSVPGSRSADDAAVIAYSERGLSSLVRKDTVEPWDESLHAYTRPVVVGGDLTWVEMDTSLLGEQVAVVRGGRRVATLPAGAPGVDLPVKGLSSWDGKWVVEIRGRVYVDGASLNDRLGADEVFGWRLIDNRPFYFFTKGGRVGVSFAGQTLPQSYEQVIHYRCCEPAAFNDGGNDRMVWFHALRDGVWHCVEMGIYDGVAPPAATPPADKRPATAERPPAVTTAEKVGSSALLRGSVEDARKITGLDVRRPTYLPAGATPDGDVAFVGGERALASIGYRVGAGTLEVRFARSDPAAAESRGELIDLGPRKAVCVARVTEPTDGTPAVARIGWLDGDAFTSVIGTLPRADLIKVAASLANPVAAETLGPADLGTGWVPRSVATPAPGNGRVRGLFTWEGSGQTSPEGFRQIVFEIEEHPDAGSAKAALAEPPPPDARAISGPVVGEASRHYMISQDGLAGVVVEAVSGPIRVHVAVLGSPQSQVKETKAAELARTILARAGR